MFKKEKNNILLSMRILILVLIFVFAKQVFADEMMRVAIPQNPYNSMAEQLNSKENALRERERALLSLQAKVEKSYEKIFVLIGLLFGLILLNFALDWFRKRKNDISKDDNLVKSGQINN